MKALLAISLSMVLFGCAGPERHSVLGDYANAPAGFDQECANNTRLCGDGWDVSKDDKPGAKK